MAATAEQQGDDWVVSGCKILVLDAHVADAFIVIARSAGAAGDTEGLCAFLVDAGAEGLSVERRSLVDSRNAGVISLEQVRVPAGNLLGEAGRA